MPLGATGLQHLRPWQRFAKKCFIASEDRCDVGHADAALIAVLPARMLRVEFDRRGLLPVALSRTVGDSPSSAYPTRLRQLRSRF
jgi:hypothetical protein